MTSIITSSPAQAAAGSAAVMVPTTWTCTNGDVLTFALPPVFTSPGAGALVAPFPGFLTEVVSGSDQPLGTWIVLGIVTSDGTISIGQKNGLTAAALTCSLGDAVTLLIAPAAR